MFFSPGAGSLVNLLSGLARSSERHPNPQLLYPGKKEAYTTGRRICRVCKAGLGPQSSAEPLGFCLRVLQQVSYDAKVCTERSCRNPKVLQYSGLGGGGWEPGPSFEDWLSFLLTTTTKRRSFCKLCLSRDKFSREVAETKTQIET